jgi:hypothetical protein
MYTPRRSRHPIPRRLFFNLLTPPFVHALGIISTSIALYAHPVGILRLLGSVEPPLSAFRYQSPIRTLLPSVRRIGHHEVGKMHQELRGYSNPYQVSTTWPDFNRLLLGPSHAEGSLGLIRVCPTGSRTKVRAWLGLTCDSLGSTLCWA